MFRVLKKFNSIFDSHKKWKMILLAVMMMIGAILETFSVSMMIPLITALLDAQSFMKNKYVQVICDKLKIDNINELIYIILIVLILIFLLKNLFLAIEYYFQYSFIANARLDIQSKLMESYLHMPYEVFLYAKSGEIQRSVLGDVTASFTLLESMLSFFTEGVAAIALSVTIFWVNPIMAGMLVIVLAILMLVIFKIVKPILMRASDKFCKEDALRNKWIIQAVTGIKEIKITNTEKFFLDNYTSAGKGVVGAEKKNSVLSSFPRLIIETISICGMLLIMIYLLKNGSNISELLPALSAFAVAAVRLLPCANRISAALNVIPYREPRLDSMIENLTCNNDKSYDMQKEVQYNKNMFQEKIEMKNISYHYPNSEQYVLQGADLCIKKGESVGIVGTSGSGKTTCVDILLGLLKVEQGQIFCDGIDVRQEYQQWLGMIGYIPQTIFMLDGTIRDNVAFGCEEINDEKIMSVIEEAQLGDFVRKLPEKLNTEIGERGIRLSGGQRQRIGIARALYREPEILVFDEATSSLDNETEAAIMESINNLHGKKTLIIIAHRLSTIEECDEIYRVEEGKIVKEG
ncbi:ABC transporter ATP-binding protein [Lachnospiraceae bacterium 38-10]